MGARLLRLFAVAVLGLWIASLFLPVARTSPAATWALHGSEVLFLGWIGIFSGQFGWMANIVIWLALLPVIAGVPIQGGYARTTATVLGFLFVSSLFWRTVSFDGGPQRIIDFGTGYYAWLAAVAFSALIVHFAADKLTSAESS